MNILCDNETKFKCEFCNKIVQDSGHYCGFFIKCGCIRDLEDRNKKEEESRELRQQIGHHTNNKKFHFDRQDLAKEVPATLRSLEESGRLNTPRLQAAAKRKLEECKDAPVIDYQIHGHPIYDGDDFKHPIVKGMNQ